MFIQAFEFVQVSTHSRLKAAGKAKRRVPSPERVSTHSRLKAAGGRRTASMPIIEVSTHSRLKAAGYPRGIPLTTNLFQHTAA